MPRPRKPVRQQKLNTAGFNAIKYGAPWGPGDIYYQLMEMSWRAFIAVTAAFYILVNLGFGLLYASLPGAVANAAPGSVADGFFFSIETLATVGYGEMAPATRAGHAIAATEILTGIFLTATITGLIFSRFARPRDSLMFSDRLVIVPVAEQRVAMLRLAGTRARPIAGAVAQLQVLETINAPNGRQYRRYSDLALVNPRSAMMGLAWTLAHVIDDTSPLKPILDDPEAELRLLVTVSGLDTLLSSQMFSSHAYTRADIHLDHEFVDIFDRRDDGSIHVDLTRLHEIQPMLPAPSPDA